MNSKKRVWMKIGLELERVFIPYELRVGNLFRSMEKGKKGRNKERKKKKNDLERKMKRKMIDR